jgi:site-specific DNA-methyltransferase (adenine-specific)
MEGPTQKESSSSKIARANSLASEHVELLNISLRDIELGDRARKSYQDVAALAEDFKKRGVISPIAVKKQEGEGKPYFLLAGGRRMAAAVLAQLSTIPCRVYPEHLSELDVREIELMENIKRANLTWQEEVWLTEEIHRLQVARYGEAVGPVAGHSAADTAKMLAVSPMTVSRDRALADALQKHPEALGKAKNKSEALRILGKMERQEVDKALSAKFDAKIDQDGVDRAKRVLVNSYITGDFFERIKNVPELAFDCVEIDPPYAIELTKTKDVNLDFSDEYEEVEGHEYQEFLSQVFSDCHRVMLPSSWIICWGAFQWLSTIYELLKETGFVPWYIPGIWNKLGIPGQTRHPHIHLASLCEPFIYARKGDALLRKQGRGNVFTCHVTPAEQKTHRTERPIELLTDILSTFVSPNSRVLVPFLGSGNTLLAANNCGCNAVGFELNGDSYKPAYTRRVLEGTLREFHSLDKEPSK